METILTNFYSQARILELEDSKGTEWLWEHALSLRRGGAPVTTEEVMVGDDHAESFPLGEYYLCKQEVKD